MAATVAKRGEVIPSMHWTGVGSSVGAINCGVIVAPRKISTSFLGIVQLCSTSQVTFFGEKIHLNKLNTKDSNVTKPHSSVASMFWRGLTDSIKIRKENDGR